MKLKIHTKSYFNSYFETINRLTFSWFYYNFKVRKLESTEILLIRRILKGGTPLRPIKFFLPNFFFRDRSIWKSWISSFQRYQTFQFSILKNVALIDLKIDGPNLVKSEGIFLKLIVCATWWFNIGESDMFSG